MKDLPHSTLALTNVLCRERGREREREGGGRGEREMGTKISNE